MSSAKEPDPTESQLIDEFRRDREEEARFFSNAAKPERERWVVKEFLTQLGLHFADDELHSPAENDPVDVSFRDANFQVKEILDPARYRHAELKRSLELARSATTLGEPFDPVEGHDIVVADLAQLLYDLASSPKYPSAIRSNTDLLVHVTRPYAGFNEPPERACPSLAALGWRSISCLFGRRSLVLAVTPDSPTFLQPK